MMTRLARAFVLCMTLAAVAAHASAPVRAAGAGNAPPVAAARGSQPVTIIPPVPSGMMPQADFWREIQRGGSGYVPGPASNPRWLMRPIDKDAECIKAGKCTHRLVGFSLPIHEKMPHVRPPVGRGPTPAEGWFTVALFGLLAFMGILFVAFRLAAPRGMEEAS